MITAKVPKALAQSIGGGFHALDDFAQLLRLDWLDDIASDFLVKSKPYYAACGFIWNGPPGVDETVAFDVPLCCILENVVQLLLPCRIRLFGPVQHEEQFFPSLERVAELIGYEPSRRGKVVLVDEVGQGIEYFLFLIAICCRERPSSVTIALNSGSPTNFEDSFPILLETV